MENFAIFRPISLNDMPPLPISLKAIGLHRARKNWIEVNHGKQRLHCGAFWAISGEAEIVISGEKYYFDGGKFISYFPFEAHKIKVLSEFFAYCWMTFDGPLAVEILKSYQFPRSPIIAGTPPITLFVEAYNSMKDYSEAARYHDSVLLNRILALAKAPKSPEKNIIPPGSHNLIRQFRNLVEQKYMSKETNLNTLSQMLSCHRTTISRLLKIELGITPTEYITNIRLQHALRLLNETTLTVAEISDQCGFATPNYFCHKVKLLTGITPHRFRNNTLSNPKK